MTRAFYEGAWYADATPAGAFVVFTPNVGFKTSQGTVPLPPGEPWGLGYVRCTDVGGLRFAGQAHSSLDPACWEWTGTGWFPFAPPCNGVSPVLYDLSGELLRSDGSIGSQGYRYAWPNGTPGGQIVTGDQTYGPWNGLSQYSQAGDSLWIGQGMADGSGVLVWDGAVLRQLEKGATTFIRVQVSGDLVSVAFNNVAGCVIYQLTQAELRALPVYGQNVPPDQPPTEPPTEPPMSIPDQSAAIQAVRVKYPTPLGVQHGSFLVEAANATTPTAMLLRKDAGTNVTIPSGEKVSQDILVYRNGLECYDVLSDGEGAATVVWIPKGPIAGEYVDVSTGQQPPQQPPTNPPQQPPAGLTEDDVRRIVRDELDGARIALQTADGKHYFCAEGGGGDVVVADRTSAGAWETFTVKTQ